MERCAVRQDPCSAHTPPAGRAISDASTLWRSDLAAVERRAVHRLLSQATLDGLRFGGYVEGHGVLSGDVDVVVTDGFTGNVALKSLEGGLGSLIAALYGVFASTDETRLKPEARV